MGLKKNKKMTQKDFSKEIANILTEAASLDPLQNPAPVIQQPKPLKPAVVFHADTCPSRDKLEAKINDDDYSIKFSRLANNKDGGLEYQYTPVDTFHDVCINYALSVGMDPTFREFVERGDVSSMRCLNDAQCLAINSINNKFATAYTQTMHYGIGVFINAVIDLIKDAGYNECADALTNGLSPLDENTRYMSKANPPFINFKNLVELIGSSKRENPNINYDDACTLVFNNIVNASLDATQSKLRIIMEEISRIVPLYEPADSPDIMVNVNDIANGIFSELCKSLFNNAYVILNEIVFASDTLYGNAEIPGMFDRYYDEF